MERGDLVLEPTGCLGRRDVAEHAGVTYGSWAASQFQGSIAGINAAGGSTQFAGIPRSHTIKVLDVDLVSISKFQPEDGSFEVVESDTDEHYHRFVFHDDCMVGSVLMGDASAGSHVKRAIEIKHSFAGLLSKHPSTEEILEEVNSSQQ